MTKPVSTDDGGQEAGGFGFITPEKNESDPNADKDVFFFHTSLDVPTAFKAGVKVSFMRQKAKQPGRSDRAVEIISLTHSMA